MAPTSRSVNAFNVLFHRLDTITDLIHVALAADELKPFHLHRAILVLLG
jgi:hypothetical protein